MSWRRKRFYSHAVHTSLLLLGLLVVHLRLRLRQHLLVLPELLHVLRIRLLGGHLLCVSGLLILLLHLLLLSHLHLLVMLELLHCILSDHWRQRAKNLLWDIAQAAILLCQRRELSYHLVPVRLSLGLQVGLLGLMAELRQFSRTDLRLRVLLWSQLARVLHIALLPANLLRVRVSHLWSLQHLARTAGLPWTWRSLHLSVVLCLHHLLMPCNDRLLLTLLKLERKLRIGLSLGL